jgi:hypothetical protein
MTVTEAEAHDIKRRHSAELLRHPGVSGVGVEKDQRGNFVLRLHVTGEGPDVGTDLPEEIDGLPVSITRGGPYRSFAK